MVRLFAARQEGAYAVRKFQAAIFDVDGTLFDYREKKIHDSTVAAIQRLKDDGATIVIASGRSFPLLGEECLSKVPADYYVTANGHSIQDSEGREIYSRRFTYRQTEKIVELTRKYGNGLMLKYGRHSCLYSRPDEMFQVFNNIGLSKDRFTYCPEMNHHEMELPLGFTVRGGEALCAELREFAHEFRVELFFDVTECDIFSPDTNKMTALRLLADILHLIPKTVLPLETAGMIWR